MIKNIRVGSCAILYSGILILLLATICSSGCINAIQKSMGPSQAVNGLSQGTTTGTIETPAPPEVTQSSLQQEPVVKATPADSVAEVTPFLTPDPYPVIHGTRIDATPLDNDPLDRTPVFERSYTLDGNAVGLLVNVPKGPLYIVFVVTPKYDCMQSPDSCRGNLAASVNRPYMTITVRDNQTQEIVAEDGYAGKYSSDTGQETFSNSGLDINTGITSTSTISPGPRYIVLYKEGAYQVTIGGAYLTVDVKIITGDSPIGQDTGNGATSSPSGNGWG